MFLFICIDILKTYWIKEYHVVEKLIDDKKLINES